MAKKKVAKQAKKEEVKPKRKGRAAFVLMAISVILLLVNGLMLVFGRRWFASMFAELGYTVSVSAFLTYGVIWLVLAVLMWVTTIRIAKQQAASEKWLLLALAIITMVAGRLESGILALIASILYLRQK